MPSADNTTLIRSAQVRNLDANGVSGETFTSDATTGTAFVIDNLSAMNVGDDKITGFKKSDSILTTKALFDGNNDKIIDYGSKLDTDRSSTSNAGADQITIEGLDSHSLRYLGTKDGYFAYADASVRLAGFTEGQVTNDTFNAGTGAKTYFFDNALGLNLGKDTINNFGADDKLVFTTKLFDSDHNGTIDFSANHLLDVSGAQGAMASDPSQNPGGQIDLNGVGGDITQVTFLETQTVNGVEYHYYGLVA